MSQLRTYFERMSSAAIVSEIQTFFKAVKAAGFTEIENAPSKMTWASIEAKFERYPELAFYYLFEYRRLNKASVDVNLRALPSTKKVRFTSELREILKKSQLKESLIFNLNLTYREFSMALTDKRRVEVNSRMTFDAIWFSLGSNSFTNGDEFLEKFCEVFEAQLKPFVIIRRETSVPRRPAARPTSLFGQSESKPMKTEDRKPIEGRGFGMPTRVMKEDLSSDEEETDLLPKKSFEMSRKCKKEPLNDSEMMRLTELLDGAVSEEDREELNLLLTRLQ